MHTVTISLQGSVNVSESIEVGDTDALPLFVKLKTVLDSGEASKHKSRRRKASEATPDSPIPEGGSVDSADGEER